MKELTAKITSTDFQEKLANQPILALAQRTLTGLDAIPAPQEGVLGENTCNFVH